MTFRRLAACAAACIALSASQSPAAIIVSIQETPAGVVATTTGRLNTTGLTPVLSGFGGAGIVPNSATLASRDPTGGGPVDIYFAISGPLSWGSGSLAIAASGGGDAITISGVGQQVAVPAGYVSGSPISSHIEFAAGTTLASLGLTPGVYNYTFNSGANADTIGVYVGVAPPAPDAGVVPEPATLATLGLLAAGGVGYVRRRKQTA